MSKYTTVTEVEVSDMMKLVQFPSVDKNEMLLTQGKLTRMAAFIIKGAVRTYYTDANGNEQTTAFAFENHPLVSLDGFFNQTPSPVNVCTIEPTDLITVDRDGVVEFLKKHPQVCRPTGSPVENDDEPHKEKEEEV